MVWHAFCFYVGDSSSIIFPKAFGARSVSYRRTFIFLSLASLVPILVDFGRMFRKEPIKVCMAKLFSDYLNSLKMIYKGVYSIMDRIRR